MTSLHAIRASPTSTSKKDPAVRKTELLASLSPALLDLITSNAKDLIRTPFGAQAVASLILSGPSSTTAARDAAAAAILALVRESEDGTDDELKKLLEQPHASRMLKNLVQGGFYDPKSRSVIPCTPPLGFGALLAGVLGKKVTEWAVGGQGFVVLALVEGDEYDGKKKVIKRLKEESGKLDKAAKGGRKGAGMVLEAVGK